MPSPPFVCIAQKGNAMPEQALQVAFEIKTACDEISRRLLRWHWERKPGAHSLDALLEHIAARKQESPDYYDPLPPAMPATPSAPPATKLPTRQLQQTAHRRRCCSTKPSRRWKRATPVPPLRRTSWRSITARQRTT